MVLGLTMRHTDEFSVVDAPNEKEFKLFSNRSIFPFQNIQGVPKKRSRYNICLLFVSFLQVTLSNFAGVCFKTMSISILIAITYYD